MKKIKGFLAGHPIILNVFSLIYGFVLRNRRKIKGYGNSVTCIGAFLKRSKIEIDGDNNKVFIEPMVKFNGLHIMIKGDHNIVRISRECVGNDVEIWIEDNCNAVEIGANTWFTRKIHMAVTEGTELRIGERCLFAEDVIIRTGDSHSIFCENGKRINHARNISIGNHVWIGNRTFLLKGTEVGDDSVVGTGAIVTKSFKKEVILAGVPAQIVKENVNWDSERV